MDVMNTVAEASVLAQNTFSHVSEGDTPYETGGLRDFFLYRDLGIAAATGGQVVAQLVKAGDCVHQRPGIVHFLFDYSPDMEYLEIVSPADFKTIDMPPPCEVPAPTPWNN
jgi:hypothetical protein